MLLAAIIILAVASLVFYFFIRYALINQVDDDLQIEKNEIEIYVKEHDQLPKVMEVRHQVINYQQTSEPFNESLYRTINAKDSVDNSETEYRSLVFGIRANGIEFIVSVMKPLETTKHLLGYIMLIILSTIVLLLAASFMISQIVLKKLWAPFFDTLNKLNSFSLSQHTVLQFPKTTIEEFDLLNNTLRTTTNKAWQDYILLKEFTENASHEMQTPLAIIQSKLDILIQDELLSEKQSQVALSIYVSIQRLSRLNQSLLLLAKIGNSQFDETAIIDFKEKIENKIEAFRELWNNDNLSVNVSLRDSAVKMNKDLVDILLNNVLSNATRHNYKGGRIFIELTDKQLSVSNSSHDVALDETRIYNKFYTNKKEITNSGLGLALVKNICDVSGFNIAYSFRDQLHVFTISW